MREKYKFDENKTVEENIALALYAIANELDKIDTRLYKMEGTFSAQMERIEIQISFIVDKLGR